jgi:hypothetical protein
MISGRRQGARTLKLDLLLLDEVFKPPPSAT